MSRSASRPFAVAAATLAVAACTTAQVRLPPGFATAAVSYEVSGHSPRRHGEPVRFGPYSALEMREGGTLSWGVPVPGFDLVRSAKPVAYTLVARDQSPVEVQCRSRAWTLGRGDADRRLEIDATALAGPLLACGLKLDGFEPRPLVLSRQGGTLQGRLSAPWGRDYAVRGLNGLVGSPLPLGVPGGYAIVDGDVPVAVVDVLNAGRVHFDPALDAERRAYFAAAATALLLLDPELGG